MNIVRYFPSAQFVVIVGSIALSGGLVIAAQTFTHIENSPATLTPASPTTIPSTQTDWLTALRSVEGDSVLATTSANAETTKTLLAGATSNNLTDTVARTLLVNLSDAKSQGLGSDIPTQEKLVAEATARIKKERGTSAYTEADLTLSSDTNAAMKIYGNAFISAVAEHPNASYPQALVAVAKATNKAAPVELGALNNISKEYKLLAAQLMKVPVPPKMRLFHLQIVNNLALMSEILIDVKGMYTDPLRGIASFNLSQGISDEILRVFTNIAQQFVEGGILFNKDEPGSEWSSFLSS